MLQKFLLLISMVTLFIIFPYINDFFTMPNGIGALVANSTASLPATYTSANGTVSSFASTQNVFAANLHWIIFLGGEIIMGLALYRSFTQPQNPNQGGV
jgi:hypothetical protein